MKNKIIAATIAVLFLPTMTGLIWCIENSFIVRIVVGIVLLVAIVCSVYQLSKLILDERCKNKRKKVDIK